MSKTFPPRNKAIWQDLGRTENNTKNINAQILLQN